MSKTIYQLDPASSLNLTDKFEVSQSNSSSSESKYGTMQQVITNIVNPNAQLPSSAKVTGLDAQLSLKANDNAVVHNTGNETIAGTKTFSSTINGNISGNAATVTTNANLTGAVTSVGNVTTISTVNANVGSFGDSSHGVTFTVNEAGQITSAADILMESGTQSLEDVYATGDNAIAILEDDRPVSFQNVSESFSGNAVETQSTGSNTVSNYRVLGWTFVPTVDFIITALQYDDALFTGSGTRETGIFLKSTNELLVSVNISKTDPLDATTVYRTHELDSPLVVQAGVEYVFATVMAGGETNHLDSNAVPGTDISITQFCLLPSSITPIPLSYPQSFTSTANTVFVGSFEYSATTVIESVDINDATTSASTLFKVSSVTRGAMPFPVMTAAERNAIPSPSQGLCVIQSNSPTDAGFYLNNGASWTLMAGGSPAAANLLIGSGTKWVSNAVSGDITINSSGVTAIGASKVTNSMLAGSIADSKLSTISTAGKVSNSATTATNLNTADAIVARDSNGDFTARWITMGRGIMNNGGAALTSTNDVIRFPSTLGDGNFVQLQGYGNWGVNSSGNQFFAENLVWDSTNDVYKYSATAAGSVLEITPTGFAFKTVASGTSGNTATPSPKLTVSHTGMAAIVPFTNIGQPSFTATVSSTISDVTGDGTAYTIVYNSTSQNTGTVFNTSTGVCTASTTGSWNFGGANFLVGLTASHTTCFAELVTTSKTYPIYAVNGANTRDVNGVLNMPWCVPNVPMSAGDTAFVRITIAGGTKVVDVFGGTAAQNSYFCGYLVA